MTSLRQRPISSGDHAPPKLLHAVPPPGSTRSNGAGAASSLDGFVDEAAAQITRYSAHDAFSASAPDGLIVDIRSQDARERDGVIPRSLHIPRTVLEWRVAIDSPWRNVHLGGVDQLLILVCDHGYSSILAARNLVELGFHRAGDIVGGFAAWKAGGLPIAECRHRPLAPEALPGTGPPE